MYINFGTAERSHTASCHFDPDLWPRFEKNREKGMSSVVKHFFLNVLHAVAFPWGIYHVTMSDPVCYRLKLARHKTEA